MNELDWKQPALIGGLIAGILSVIPGVEIGNCCFCAWLVIGGAIAAKMVISRTQRQVKIGEGAQIGAIAGLIASAVYIFLNLVSLVLGIGQQTKRDILARLSESVNNPEFQEMMQKILEASANQTTAQRLVAALPGMILFAVLFVGFSTLGGLLGVALFEKRRDQPPPPQYPPGYPPNPPGYPPNYPPQSGGPGPDQGGWPQR